MSNSIDVFRGKFFAISLQEHKILGATFTAHIVELLSIEGGIYTVLDNVFPDNLAKWSELVSPEAERIVRILDEVSDSRMFRVVGRRKKSVADFYKAIQTDEVFGGYVRSYFERRIAKCYDTVVASDIPIFLKDKKFSNLYHDHLLLVQPENAEPVFRFSVTPIETRYTLEATCKGERVSLRHRQAQIVTYDPCIIRLGYRLFRFDGIDAKKLLPFFTKEFISIPQSAEKKYFETFVLNAIKTQIVIPEGFKIVEAELSAKAILSLETRLNGSLGLVLYFRYGDKNYLSQSKPQKEVSLKVVNGTYVFTRFSRNVEWEDAVKDTIKSFGLANIQGAEFAPADNTSDYELIAWVNANALALAQKDVEIVQQLRDISYYIKGYNLDLKAKLENDWFDIYGMVKLTDFEFPFILLRKNIIKGIREFILPNGQVFVIPEEWFAKYKGLFVVGSVDSDKLVLPQSGFGFIQQAQVHCPDAESLKERFANVTLAQHVEIPAGLNAQLRDYQKLGLLWLQLLYDSGMGGCLADDMGLGKTIQTLAVLLHDAERRESNGDQLASNGLVHMGRTSLLVVPTSLLFNWQREVERFAPSLTIYQFTGPNRTRSVTELVNYDMVLTTYGVLRNEIDLLKDVRFNFVVLDESQTIKNPASKVYRSAVLLKAKHYISLSGTPIENSLTDLWVQINFLNRGMLGSLRSFREQFITPIEKNKDEKAQETLKKLVEPFIMRRSKHEVAPELPQLTEEVVYCNLSEQQRSIYEEEKSKVRNSILENIESVGYGQSAISILRGLTRLRQISNHPQMLEEYQYADSGKFDEVVRTVEALVEENHKVLIFSSFVKHLRIVEKQLENTGVAYQMLVGSTTNRQQIVDEFQNNPSCHVFLISIKAGGVGLNLTAADYILVLDPWWNPAVENQAIARAHRIGQDKPVFVYRFISVGTVEEKIRRLQERKLLLSSHFVDSSNPLSAISQEQMMEILG
ncbi:MAG: DEAD/DEAH box helicase [Bacteroidales bacterium]|nr:DEAD/DEAH box helicase [Bacteroidales bacterium]